MNKDKYFKVILALSLAGMIGSASSSGAQEARTAEEGGGFFDSEIFDSSSPSSQASSTDAAGEAPASLSAPSALDSSQTLLPNNPQVDAGSALPVLERGAISPEGAQIPTQSAPISAPDTARPFGTGDGGVEDAPDSVTASPFTRTAPRYSEGGISDQEAISLKKTRIARITPFVGASATYSDNVNLTSDNEEGGMIYGVGAGVTGDYRNNRLDAIGTAGVEARFGDIDQNAAPYVQGAGTAELVKNRIFVDAAGSYTTVFDSPLQGSTYSGAGSEDAEGLGQFSISPYWRERIGSWGVSELRYAHDEAFATSDTIGEIRTDAFQGKLATAKPIDRVSLEGLVAYADTSYSDPLNIGEGDLQQTTGLVTGAYSLNRKLALLAQAGYDKVKSDGTPDDEFSGAIFNGGFEYRPNRRARLQALAGTRYNGLNYLVDGSYQITEKLYAGATAATTLQPPVGYGSQSLRLAGNQTDAIIKLANDQFSGNVAEALRQRYNIEARDFGVTSDGALVLGNSQNTKPYRSQTVTGYTGVNDGATTYTGVLSYENRNYQSVEDEDAISGVASVTHQLNQKVKLGAEAFYYALLTDFANNENHTYGGRLSAAYALTDYADLYGALSRTQRQAKVSTNDYVEHAATVGVNARF